MKAYLTLFLIILFCGVNSYVTIFLYNHELEKRIISLLTHVPLLLFFTTITLVQYWGDNTITDIRVQMIGKFVIISFLTVYCLNNLGWVNGATRKLFYFYGMNLAGLLILLISSYRHKSFKQ